MKHILAPTDFSEDAFNALLYAANLAKDYNTKLTLLHVYTIPIPVSSHVALEEVPYDNHYETQMLKALEKTKNKLLELVGKDLDISYEAVSGDISAEIENAYVKNDIDLIITGISKKNQVWEYIVGSTTTDLFRDQCVPVLAIPFRCKYKKVKSMLIAKDAKPIDALQNKYLGKFIKFFQCKVSLLRVANEFDEITNTGLRIQHFSEGIEDAVYYVREYEDVVHGVIEFAKETNADLIVVIPRKHSLFGRMFYKSNSKKIAFNSLWPVLSIPSEESCNATN